MPMKVDYGSLSGKKKMMDGHIVLKGWLKIAEAEWFDWLCLPSNDWGHQG